MLIRIISGVIGIALAAFIVQTGGNVFAGAGLLLAFGAWYEYCNAFREKGYKPTLVTGMVLISVIWAGGWLGNAGFLVGATMFSVLTVMLLTVLNHDNFDVLSAVISVAGVFYIGLSFTHLVMLRFMGGEAVIPTCLGDFQLGCAFLWIALIGTWASDTFAYFAGFAFGKHKLVPVLSPKKTVEGAVGGTLGAMAVGAVFGYLLYNNVTHNTATIWVLVIITFVGAIISQLGDLLASGIKRDHNIKDYGHIIPGHGGIMDRFDSVIFVTPCIYFLAAVLAPLIK